MNVVEEYTCTNNDTNIDYVYAYRLIKREYNHIPVFGIEVERKDYINLQNVNLERERIELISPKRHKVKQLLMILHNNQVSPIHLIDVIGNDVDQCIYEFDSDLPNKIIN